MNYSTTDKLNLLQDVGFGLTFISKFIVKHNMQVANGVNYLFDQHFGMD